MSHLSRSALLFGTLVVILSSFLICSDAIILKLKDKQFSPYLGYRIGLFAPDVVPALPPGNGQAYVSFNLNLVGLQDSGLPSNPTSIQALVFAREDEEYIGFENTDELCDGDEVFIRRQSPSLFVQNMTVPGSASFSFPITTTAMYTMMLSKCSLVADKVSVTGTITFMNPNGHLPGEMYGDLPFFGLMVALYGLLLLIWIGLSVRYRHDILRLQHMIGVVIFCGFIECMLDLADYSELNQNGTWNNALTGAAIFFEIARRTISRLLVLIVCLGFGIVKPTLGPARNKVIITGALYFISSGVLEVMSSLYISQQTTLSMVMLASVPVSLLDAIFILWIFNSLSRTLQDLANRQQSAKLRMYELFKTSVGVYVIASMAWVLAELYFSSPRGGGTYGPHWRSAWVFDAFWLFSFFAILCVIAFIWRPNPSNSRYAYMQELSSSDEFSSSSAEAIMMEMEGIDALNNRQREGDNDNDADINNLHSRASNESYFDEDDGIPSVEKAEQFDADDSLQHLPNPKIRNNRPAPAVATPSSSNNGRQSRIDNMAQREQVNQFSLGEEDEEFADDNQSRKLVGK